VLASPAMNLAAQRRRTHLLLLLLYLPFFAWSLVGAGWTLWHHPFIRWFLGGYLLIVIVQLLFRRGIGGAVLMSGIAGCHLATAFALNTWLRLPIWTVPAFLVASIALLVAFRLTDRPPSGQ